MWDTLFGNPSAADLAKGNRHGLVDIVRNHETTIAEAIKDMKVVKKTGLAVGVLLAIQVIHNVGPDLWRAVVKLIGVAY